MKWNLQCVHASMCFQVWVASDKVTDKKMNKK